MASALALALWAPLAKAAPPPNDDFAQRQLLNAPLPIEVTGSNLEATKESPFEEVGAFAAGHSVWFEWPATISGWVTVGTCAAPFSTVLGVFTGTDDEHLTRVASGNGDEGPHCVFGQREYTFKASTGTDYEIGVDGNGFFLPEAPKPVSEGTFPLRIEATPVPANDDFSNPVTVAGRISEEPGGHRFFFATANGANWNATKELGEPDHGGDSAGASVWYRWTAPESGTARISACCRQGTILALYSGASLGALAPVSSTSGFPASVVAPVSAGTTYRIAVDGPENGSSGEAVVGSFQLQLAMELSPGPGEAKLPLAASGPARDLLAPATALGKRMIKPNQRQATFNFSSGEVGSSFRCKLDGRRFSACRAPKTYKNLALGKHTFKVLAVDAAGNADPTPAVARFAIPRPTR